MALRVKSVDYEPNVGWAAVTQGEVHTTAGDNTLTLPACDEFWFNDRALGAVFPTNSHSLGRERVGNVAGVDGGGGVTGRREECSFSIKVTNFPIPKRSNEVTKMGTTRKAGRDFCTVQTAGLRARVHN
ncbi:hypothetical protein B0H10DRAFT_1956170 [Mycena sp. CBHHK59/15]|nr:hypothetical protein B0H10DRAFT_1956170 [Mycena sp. CBHHK59/15]